VKTRGSFPRLDNFRVLNRSSDALYVPSTYSRAQHTHAQTVTQDEDVLVQWSPKLSYQKLNSEHDIDREAKDHFLDQWRNLDSFQSNNGTVRYGRNFGDIQATGEAGNCKSMPRVLQWLFAEMSKRNCTLMLAYGGLIHVYREGDLINNQTGKYIDDDLDLWASSNTVYNIIQLEPVIFYRFGWTYRTFLSADGFVVFLQLIASCGHSPVAEAAKASANEPALEIYVLHGERHAVGERVVKDLWQGTQIPEAILYPPGSVCLNVTGIPELLYLQVPKLPYTILNCIYGEWKIPSKNHASQNVKC